MTMQIFLVWITVGSWFLGMICDVFWFVRRRRFTPREMRARGMGEVVDFVNIKGRMGESLQEVAKESFESSEL